jgi:DHA3 family macrolide efflux protein-like MFS transporter
MMNEARPERYGMAAFGVVWAGQVVSGMGSNLTGFALAVWVYQQTGSTTRFALIALVTVLPGILLAPIAGALVDRWDRRRAMILADGGAAAATLALALLVWCGRLALWHIYLLLAAISLFGAWRWPAFSAATTSLVPDRHRGRASGMMELGDAAAEIVAPLLAGALVVRIGRQGVLLIDFATYLFAMAALLAVRIPRPAATVEGSAAGGSLLREARSGWLFIRRRPGLLALLVLFASTNLGLGMVQVLLSPMVLAFASPAVLGQVLAVAACGMLAGSLVMSLWGGPRRRIAGILGFLLVQGLVLPLGGLRASAPLIAAGAFVFLFASPIASGCSQALWQSKVALDLQGRVFALRRMIAWSTFPLACLLAGPLADRVFEPLLAPGGPLAGSVGRLIGVGKGRGIALLFIVLGLLVLLMVAAAWHYPRLARLEAELPDALAMPAEPVTLAALARQPATTGAPAREPATIALAREPVERQEGSG